MSWMKFCQYISILFLYVTVESTKKKRFVCLLLFIFGYSSVPFGWQVIKWKLKWIHSVCQTGCCVLFFHHGFVGWICMWASEMDGYVCGRWLHIVVSLCFLVSGKRRAEQRGRCWLNKTTALLITLSHFNGNSSLSPYKHCFAELSSASSISANYTCKVMLEAILHI